jgi:hypothetical protein
VGSLRLSRLVGKEKERDKELQDREDAGSASLSLSADTGGLQRTISARHANGAVSKGFESTRPKKYNRSASVNVSGTPVKKGSAGTVAYHTTVT